MAADRSEAPSTIMMSSHLLLRHNRTIIRRSTYFRHANVADECADDELDFLIGLVIERCLDTHILEHAALPPFEHLRIAEEGIRHDMDADLVIIRDEYLHVADEGGDRNARLAVRNLSLRQIERRVADEMRDIHRLQLPIIAAQMDVPDESGTRLDVRVVVPPL